MSATLAQSRSYLLHKQLCLGLGISQCTFEHRGLKGTIGTASPTGNQIYKGPGPLIKFDAQVLTSTQIWCVYQPFIRGEERPDDTPIGIVTAMLLEGQMPAVDDNGNVLTVSPDDFIITAEGVLWKLMNPINSPDQSFWTFMMEETR